MTSSAATFVKGAIARTGGLRRGWVDPLRSRARRNRRMCPRIDAPDRVERLARGLFPNVWIRKGLRRLADPTAQTFAEFLWAW